MAADPKAIIGAFTEGMEVSPSDMQRAQLWVLLQIAEEMEHVCANIASVCEHFEIPYATAPTEDEGV